MKLIIDILMFITMIMEFQRGIISPLLHEILGIILLILIVIHLIFNKNYLKNIFKGKYNLERTIMVIINLSFFISFILTIIFGILSSISLFKFLNIGNIEIIKLHKIFSYISLIILGFHIGLNFNLMFNKIIKKVNKYVLIVIELLIIVYGIYSFIKLDIIKHLIGIYGFSVIDSNLFINMLRYICIVIMIGIIVNKIMLLKRRKNER